MNARLSSGETAAAPTSLTSAAGSSSGLGDIVVKGKYQFYQRPGGGWAAAADLRLPTGDFFNLRGAPFALLKLYAVGSMETGAFAPHVNAGITVSPRDVLTRVGFPLAHASVSVEEFNYSGGADVIAGPRVTIVADLLGRTRRHASLLEDFTDPDGPFTVFTFTNDDVPITQVLASLGMKLNVHRTLLVTVSALTPAYTRHALASHLAIVGGVDYAF
jgi:hypothetical protein